MTTAVRISEAAGEPAPDRRLPVGPLLRVSDRVLDGTVILLATWTVIYHVCLVLGLGAPWAVVFEIVALTALTLVLWRRTTSSAPPRPADVQGADALLPLRTAPPLLLVTLGATVIAAIAMAASLPWAFVWTSWLVAAGAGSALAIRTPTTSAAATATADPWEGTAVALWAVALTVMSTLTIRPNPDDLYYVNLSQWVASHGTFPTRDTIFSDLVFPMSNWPPVASYDPLVGAAAHVAGVQAGSVVYMVVPPIATLLAVLALWRLLRAWRVPNISVALSAAFIFLLFDGGSSYAPPGNLFLTRLWQGKVILLCLLVPLLLVYALRFVERPTRSRAAWLFAGGTAAVGLSTTAMFLVPLIAAAGAAPLLRRAPRKALLGFAAMAAYPLAAGIVTKAMGGRSADDFAGRRLYRFDPSWFGHAIFLTGLLAIVAVSAVLLGAVLVPHRDARLTTGLLVLVTGVTFIPGVTHLSYDTVGLGPTLWRVSWAVTVAALVGVLVGSAACRLRRRSRRVVAGVTGIALMVAFGMPIWGGGSGASWAAPFHWQRNDETRAVAAAVIRNSAPGVLVLAPDDLAITLDVTTTDIKTVAPRDYFMDYLRDDPAFQYPDRITLVDFVNHSGRWRIDQVTRAIDALGVTLVCVYAEDRRRFQALKGAGYTPFLRSVPFRCVRT